MFGHLSRLVEKHLPHLNQTSVVQGNNKVVTHKHTHTHAHTHICPKYRKLVKGAKAQYGGNATIYMITVRVTGFQMGEKPPPPPPPHTHTETRYSIDQHITHTANLLSVLSMSVSVGGALTSRLLAYCVTSRCRLCVRQIEKL